ncbi:MAG: cell envelope integrity protein CreD, partial [Verrucomicrobia subdivision 3 bacterium]|nr:cell envelope integrity protein CreD [Limisphaerales bacterium]
LVGSSICIFYMLVLSLSEHIRFVAAYAIASGADVRGDERRSSDSRCGGWQDTGSRSILMVWEAFESGDSE